MNAYDVLARYYDADLRDFHEDLPFLREMARRADGPLLELMCGTGRLLLPLAEAGFTITGVDSSPAMLDIARARVQEAGLDDRITLLQGDVRDVTLPAGAFSLAFIAVNSFMHLETVRDQLACLTNVRRALQRHGMLIIDLFNPNPTEILREDNRLVLEREYELDGRHVQKFVAIDSDIAAQISRVTLLYDETDADGRVTRRTLRFVLRWLYRFEVEHLLARTGFMTRAVYGSYDLNEYDSNSPRLIVVASPAR
ncbi:MAG: class I SAM-dependent methyltransferase [Oscillochloridaceae bacterium]|nr:class I SAM-dependent methyltransferase [Chloroflexaceae bacterium]MDW8390510.1 class I SAM-dependent methyltransferase [Oscillochloridaceae bacterium]